MTDTPTPKPKIPFSQILEAAKLAGAKDVPRVASCIAMGVAQNGLEKTIAIWQEKRPDLFWRDAVVVDAREREGSGEGREHFRGRRKRETEFAGPSAN